MRSWATRILAAAGLAAVAGLPAAAWAQVYRCESDNGVPLFQNAPTGRNCRKLDLQPLMTIPAPKLPSQAAPRAGQTGGQGGAGQGNTAAGAPTAASGASGSSAAAVGGGVRIDAATQRARDSDRRRIIEDELKREEQRLAETRREFNNGEPERRADERNYQKYLDRVEQLKADIARSEGNVASLRRELGALRD